MKHLLLTAFAVLVLSIFGGATAVHAADPAGHQFCRSGVPSNVWLAQKIEQSLAAHPDGSGHVDGCYATVYEFYIAFKNGDPKSTKLGSLADLPGFLRSTVRAEAKADYQYNSSCIYEEADGTHEVKMGCATRDLHPGEIIYQDPETNELVLLSGCANPGVTEVPPVIVEANPCVEVHFPTQVAQGQQAVRFAYIGRHTLPGRCIALQRADGSKVTDMPEECPDAYKAIRDGRLVQIVCTWQDVEEAASGLLGYPASVQNVSGSFYIRATGDNVLYLPKEALDGETAICWELPNGQFVTYGVRRENFVNGVATIPPERVYGN